MKPSPALDERLQVFVRQMTPDDIDRVLMIDKMSFPKPWPRRVYHSELSPTSRSTFLVLEAHDSSSEKESNSPRFLQRLPALFKKQNNSDEIYPILGYSGFWHVVDEVHISTIAVHPDWRGYKLGELLIWLMMREAMRRRAQIVTLEVRVSNDLAQKLYRKYGFQVYSRRKGYYSDNKEDAFNMGVEIGKGYRDRLITYGRDLVRVLKVEDSLQGKKK